MDEERQLPLIKRFMLRLAPEILRFGLKGEIDWDTFPIENAERTLELAMHLAAVYARLYDSLHSEKNPTPADQQETTGSD